MKLAQIQGGKVYWIFDPLEYWGRNEIPDFVDITVIDITDNPQPIEEGWIYDELHQAFYDPAGEIRSKTDERLKQYEQKLDALAKYIFAKEQEEKA